MDRTQPSGPIVLVSDAAASASDLERRLEADAPCPVRSVAHDGGVDEVIDGEAGGDRPAAIVVELDSGTRIRRLLERCHEALSSVPTIVSPRAGDELVATAALRADATDYVPSERRDEAVDRVLSTIRTEPDRGSETGRRSADEPATDGPVRLLANELPDEAFVIGEDGTYLEAEARDGVTAYYDSSFDSLVGGSLEDVFPEAVAAELQACVDRAIRSETVQTIEYDSESRTGTRRFEARVLPLEERIRGQRAVVWLARDITERVERERALRSRQSRLETLNRINAVARQVIETLVEARTQDDIERDVCAQLVDSELYCGSWIAERTGEEQFSYRTGAGEAEATLECLRRLADDEGRPSIRAVRTDGVQTVDRFLEHDELPDVLRAAAREDDVRSAVTTPISHNGVTYGVLGVLAGRDDAFGETERAEFRLLGEAIAFAIRATKNRQLLFADVVVELEFRIDGGETFSFDLSEEYDCVCSLEWAGTTARGRTFQYVTIEGLDGETTLAAAERHESIEECRLIYDGAKQCTIEVRLRESGVRALSNHGATIRDVTVEDGVGTCLVEVSRDADVREISEALTRIYEGTDLVARRQIDRPVRTAAERRSHVLDRLTERQLTTIRLAYYSGFFDWPRASTGEEIAESMDVSAPTMHQHLRKGLKEILGEFFVEGGGTVRYSSH